VIPVIDLKSGVAVHAVRGERERYRPLRSGLVAGPEPLDVARAYRDQLGCDELYVADLDAIAGGPLHAEALAPLAQEARVMVDAGVTDLAAARPLLELGAARVVIGTETLADIAALERLAGLPLVLSLDLRDGRLLSRDPELAGLAPAEAFERLACSGVREVIVLDLARVGSGAGPQLELVNELHTRCPELELLAGGGVRHLADLRALAEAGAAGALVATALHNGAIGADELRALSPRPSPDAPRARPQRRPPSPARRPASPGSR
jgi:phosphoribosylformimino-5-aminoimidazole carboxamide ribotide isomerase